MITTLETVLHQMSDTEIVITKLTALFAWVTAVAHNFVRVSLSAFDEKLNGNMSEIEDPVELMLKKTGCIDLHYKVQECIAETNDWRKCQSEVKDFKKCMQTYTDHQRAKYENTN